MGMSSKLPGIIRELMSAFFASKALFSSQKTFFDEFTTCAPAYRATFWLGLAQFIIKLNVLGHSLSKLIQLMLCERIDSPY